MQKKWLVVRNNTSPHISPSNSDDEESMVGDDKPYSSELDAKEAVVDGLTSTGDSTKRKYTSKSTAVAGRSF